MNTTDHLTIARSLLSRFGLSISETHIALNLVRYKIFAGKKQLFVSTESNEIFAFACGFVDAKVYNRI
jgi:hypothetical protein